MADADQKGDVLTERSIHMLPRLPVFSGDAKYTSFDLWQFEVQCLQAEKRPEKDIKLAIRRSLKGQASRTLMSLGIEASVEDILSKFKSVFGPTESINTVLSTFYGLKQKDGEDAGSFANRLVDCLYQATQLGRVDKAPSPAMLKEAFEAGLKPQTRVAVGFLFSRSDLIFESLVKEVKRIERELNLSSPVAVRSVQDSQIEQLTAQVAQLKTELQSLKHSRPQESPAPLPVLRPSKGNTGFRPPRAPAPCTFAAPRSTSRQQVYRQPSTGSMNQPRGAAAYQYAPRGHAAFQHVPRGHGDPTTCWKCGQVGHISRGCRQQGHLNDCQPVATANPQASQYPAWWGGQQSYRPQ